MVWVKLWRSDKDASKIGVVQGPTQWDVTVPPGTHALWSGELEIVISQMESSIGYHLDMVDTLREYIDAVKSATPDQWDIGDLDGKGDDNPGDDVPPDDGG